MLTTSVERLEGFKAKLTVTVSADEVDAALDETYKAMAKKYRFPGFRPGRAPRQILDKHLGQGYILAEATEKLVNESYPKALDAESLRTIESPEMDEEMAVIEAGEPYTYTAELQLRPELTLSGYTDFEIILPPSEASEKDIDGEIEGLRDRLATLVPVEDRGVASDDFVLLSFVGTVEGEAYEGNTVDKYLYQMNHGLMPAEFDAGLIGATAGEERTVSFVIPDTSSNEEFVGKTANFVVNVHEIKEKALPAVDDELAVNFGSESLEALREDLRQRITLQKRAAYSRLQEERLRDALSERLVGDIPESMVVSRRESMMRDFMSMLETREMDLPGYLASTGITMDQLDADIEAQAVKSLREELSLEALARHLDLEANTEDIDREIAEIGDSAQMTPEEARQRWEDLGLMPVMREQIRQRKAMEWLTANATAIDSTSAEAPAAKPKKAPAKKKAAAKSAPEGE